MRMESLEDRRLLSLTNFGATDPINGFPIWFEDSNGVRVELMPFYLGDAPFDNGQPLVPDPLSLAAPPVAGNAFSERIGFGEEAFWWSADAGLDIPASDALPLGGTALLVLAQEAAFPNVAEPQDGEQFAFGRVRVRMDAPFDGTYTVTTPYGDLGPFTVTAGVNAINVTNDVGDVPPYANRAALTTDNPIGPFLIATNAPAGHLGDPNVESTVTGSPTGNNFFSITGPFGGVGTSVTLTTDLFAVSGRLFPGAAPVVVNPIADQVVPTNAPPAVIDVSAVFDDADFGTIQGDVLTLSVTSDNPAVVAAALDPTVVGNVVNTNLTLTYGPNPGGTAIITLRATDQAGLFVEDVFSVLVTPFFNPPTVANPVANATVDEDATPVVIDLSAVFNDPDTVGNGDVLTLSLLNDNPALLSASLTGNQLTLTLQPTANGAANISVTATDLLGQSVTDTFLVTVTPLNDDSPAVAQALAGVTRDEDATPVIVNLNGIFTDPDLANGDLLTLSVLSNPALVNASVVGNQLQLTLQPHANGAAAVDVTATDTTGRTATSSFLLTVNAVNDNPTVAAAAADVARDEDADPVVVDLSGVFADVDIATNADQLALSVTGNTNPGLVGVSQTGNQLQFTFPANANGTADITVTATDLAGLSITDTFAVTVNAVNDNPTVAQTIADMMLGIGKPAVVIDLAAIFADVDIATNADQLTFSAVGDNPAALVPNVTGTQLTLQPSGPGTTAVTVAATDSGGLSVQTGFSILSGFEHAVQLPAGGPASFASVSNVNGNLRVMNRGRMLLNAPLADALSLTIAGGDNKADTVTLNLAGVNGAALPGGIVVNGGAGRGLDALIVRGTAGDDSFTVNAQGVTLGGVQVPITGVERVWLDGRVGNDTYAIQSLPVSTSILDARGTDTLDFSGALGPVNVNLGRANAQRVFGGTTWLKLQSAVTIENVIGTALNDVITGNALANLILGGDGDDIIRGGAGSNVMIGGLGADNIRGGANSDLLIGGATASDNSPGDLLAILAEWSARRSIDLRIGNLTPGLLSPANVPDDGAADTLFGGLGGDWFLSFAGDNVMDRGIGDRPVI
jgi:hypothetical protein